MHEVSYETATGQRPIKTYAVWETKIEDIDVSISFAQFVSGEPSENLAIIRIVSKMEEFFKPTE